jgi:Fe-S-cluster containining protein
MSLNPAKEASICIGCGLCCDGTLHSRTTVKGADEQAVRAAGLEIQSHGDKRSFAQPCLHHSCGSCAIYAARPRVCRTYRCKLLVDFEGGAISRAAAREKVATAKSLVERVNEIDGASKTPAARSALAHRLRDRLTQADGSDRLNLSGALLKLAKLEYFLNRWFLDNEKTGNSSSAGGSSTV